MAIEKSAVLPQVVIVSLKLGEAIPLKRVNRPGEAIMDGGDWKCTLNSVFSGKDVSK